MERLQENIFFQYLQYQYIIAANLGGQLGLTPVIVIKYILLQTHRWVLFSVKPLYNFHTEVQLQNWGKSTCIAVH